MYLLLKKLFPQFVEKGKKTDDKMWNEAIEMENQSPKKAD